MKGMILAMEIFTLLDELEDILDRSRNLPFSAKTVVNKEEILDLLKEIRLKLPDELKQAKWVKEERQRILVEAQKEAANEMSREISKGTKEYADNLLGGTENVLTDTLAKLEQNMSQALNLMQISMEDTIKTIQNSRKELK